MLLTSISEIDCKSHVLARTTLRQLKHAMNSVGDEVHRFALPDGATQTAIEARMTHGAMQKAEDYLVPTRFVMRLCFEYLNEVFVGEVPGLWGFGKEKMPIGRTAFFVHM